MTVLGRDRYERCIDALAHIGPDSLDGLITVIKSGSSGRRWAAIGSLAGMHTNAIVALPAVVECLVGRNEHVGWKAAGELSRLYVPRSILLPYLTDSLQTASPAARVRILRCLLWIGPEARPALPAVYVAMSDLHPEVREAAARAAEVISRDPQPRFKTRQPVSAAQTHGEPPIH
jgi:HEAT repeat protein